MPSCHEFNRLRSPVRDYAASIPDAVPATTLAYFEELHARLVRNHEARSRAELLQREEADVWRSRVASTYTLAMPAKPPEPAPPPEPALAPGEYEIDL